MTKFFVHPQAICESDKIGAGTKIWAFAHVLPQARLGADCNICDSVFIENDVVIGNRVTIKCGVQLWDGVTLEDDVFVGPNATFTNDLFPRSKIHRSEVTRTCVRLGASIGANATLLAGIEIGSRAMIGAGAVVTRSVPPNAIVTGNPAQIVGYVDAPRSRGMPASPVRADATTVDLEVGGASLRNLKLINDMRGDLTVGDFETDLPFIPQRYFMVFGVPNREVRGEHAHKRCHQFLVCVHGSVSILLDDGRKRRELVLDRANIGVHMPPMIWGTQYKYTSNAVLLVFASHSYDPSDYIRTYDEFIFLQSKAA